MTPVILGRSAAMFQVRETHPGESHWQTIVVPHPAEGGVGLSTTLEASSHRDARGVPDFGVTTRFSPLVNTIENRGCLPKCY